MKSVSEEKDKKLEEDMPEENTPEEEKAGQPVQEEPADQPVQEEAAGGETPSKSEK